MTIYGVNVLLDNELANLRKAKTVMTTKWMFDVDKSMKVASFCSFVDSLWPHGLLAVPARLLRFLRVLRAKSLDGCRLFSGIFPRDWTRVALRAGERPSPSEPLRFHCLKRWVLTMLDIEMYYLTLHLHSFSQWWKKAKTQSLIKYQQPRRVFQAASMIVPRSPDGGAQRRLLRVHLVNMEVKPSQP